MTQQRLSFEVEKPGATMASLLRAHLPGQSWSRVKRLIEGRMVRVNGELWLDPARRLKVGDRVELLKSAEKLPQAFTDDLAIRYLDEHVVVVEKPEGINTVRHPAELNWKVVRRGLSPTLEDRLQAAIAVRLGKSARKLPPLRKVHRLDKLTSGLLVFARSALAERELGGQFRAHTVERQYLAIVPGRPQLATIRTWLVRDRGDGRRGSAPTDGFGKLAITHLEKVEPLGEYSLVTCRLETGRTHQIRIHLAEIGHPICGDPVYINRVDGTKATDSSGSPCLALHAVVLGFIHPASGKKVRWEMPPPANFQRLIERISRHGDSVDRR